MNFMLTMIREAAVADASMNIARQTLSMIGRKKAEKKRWQFHPITFDLVVAGEQRVFVDTAALVSGMGSSHSNFMKFNSLFPKQGAEAEEIESACHRHDYCGVSSCVSVIETPLIQRVAQRASVTITNLSVEHWRNMLLVTHRLMISAIIMAMNVVTDERDIDALNQPPGPCGGFKLGLRNTPGSGLSLVSFEPV